MIRVCALCAERLRVGKVSFDFTPDVPAPDAGDFEISGAELIGGEEPWQGASSFPKVSIDAPICERCLGNFLRAIFAQRLMPELRLPTSEISDADLNIERRWVAGISPEGGVSFEEGKP